MRRRDVSKFLLGSTAAVTTSAMVETADAQSASPEPVQPGDVTLYSAARKGAAEWDEAVKAALASNDVVYFPPGEYLVKGPIVIPGHQNKSIIGSRGGSSHRQHSVIVHQMGTDLKPLFSLQSIPRTYGAVCIANLYIRGGRRGYAIESSRSQSLFENLLIESYDGGGIRLYEQDHGAWATTIRNCEWSALTRQPRYRTAYRGFQIAVNGGFVVLDNCTAIHGDIGINVDQCEALVINRANVNRQHRDYSNESMLTGGQCGIRLASAGYKRAISITGSYIEQCANGVWVENVDSLDIADSFIDDTVAGIGSTGISLRTPLARNTTIRNCNIRQQTAGSIAIDNRGSKTVLLNNYIDANGADCKALRTDAPVHLLANTIVNGQIEDIGHHVQDMTATDVPIVLSVVGKTSPGNYQVVSQQSSYTRIGRRVWLDFDITFAAAISGGGAGDLLVTGTPLTKKDGTFPMGSALLKSASFNGTVGVSFESASASNSLCLHRSVPGDAATPLPISTISAGDRISGSICYQI